MSQDDLATRPVHDLDTEQLRTELARTKAAFADYVRRVGAVPQEASADLPPDARRHLEVQEALDRLTDGSAVVEFVAERP
jgi:hypothetical protein